MAGMDRDPTADDWRPILAVLANPGTRRMFAEVVLGAERDAVGTGLSASKRKHALDSLFAAGLVRKTDAGLVECPEVFARVLAAAARPRPSGVERFLNGRGEIDRYPVNAGERRALLAHVADRVLPGDEVIGEAELNERLRPFSADTATLRRALVDEEILERTRSGTQYARVTGA